MRRSALLLLTLLCAASASASSRDLAIITVHVRFDGKIPPAQVIGADRDPFCGEVGRVEDVMVGKRGALRDAVVLLIATGGTAAPALPVPAEPVRLVERGCRYTPIAQTAIAGQALVVHSEDSTTHSVNAHPSLTRGLFDEAQPSSAPRDVQKSWADLKFGPQGGALTFDCDYHPWMKAVIVWRTTPWAAVTGSTGTVTFRAPPGRYVIEAFHPALAPVRTSLIGTSATLVFH